MLRQHECNFPMPLVKEIDLWRQDNNNKFSSKEIFREEFLKFIEERIQTRMINHFEDIEKRNRNDFTEALKMIKQESHDIGYELANNNRALAELARLVTAQTITKLKKKSK